MQPGIGDRQSFHPLPFPLALDAVYLDITITLTFLKSMSNYEAMRANAASCESVAHGTLLGASRAPIVGLPSESFPLGSQKIDPQAPLVLYSSMLIQT